LKLSLKLSLTRVVSLISCRAIVTATDKESGIKSTRYRIIDKRHGTEVFPEKIVAAIQRDFPDRKRVIGVFGYLHLINLIGVH